MTGKNIIELKNISKSYVRDTNVIENLNLEIKKGEFVTLLGPSGCGKTTILRMIGGFEEQSGGEIYLNGKEISQVLPHKRPINTVFQKYALFPFMNVYKNIAFGLKMQKLAKEEIDKKVKKVLEIVDLEGFENREISTLSGGQQQRVAIARAVVNEPEILLLDEPLGALDYKMRREMQLELKQMHDELGITFLYVTHDQEEALTMSDKIAVMSDGKILQMDTPENIYKKPNNIFVADFIGESNIFNGFVTGGNKVNFCDREFDYLENLPVGTKIDAIIRPEHVKIVDEKTGEKTGKNQMKGKVISCVFKGTYHEVTILIDDKVELFFQSLQKQEEGKEITIVIEEKHIHLIPYDMSKNHFDAYINDELKVQHGDIIHDIDILKLFPDASYSKGQLKNKKGKSINPAGMQVSLYFDAMDAKLSDDKEEGIVTGNIVSIIYKGDHYSYTVRTETDEDYYVDDEWLWNIDDYVSLIIPEDKIHFELKNANK